MQSAVASFQLALVLFAVPTHAGVYAPSLLTDGDDVTTIPVVLKIPVLPPGQALHSFSTPSQPSQYGCEDDPSWVDQDGDGCSAYALAISSGQISQEMACGFEQATGSFEGDFAGAASHCRATCGTCPNLSKQQCVDDPTWEDKDGDGCDVYATHIQSGALSRSVACGFDPTWDDLISGDPVGAAQHCRVTCGTCDSNPQMAAESPEVDRGMLSSVEDEEQCKDDPNWVDMDGDGCAAYAEVLATGDATQAQLCGRAQMELISGNPGEAAKYCPVTCGNCNLEAFEDNDADMKDMIRFLVEQESENILKSAHGQEAVKEDVPEVTTTTTTQAKKLPEVEVSKNCTWMEYWDPEAKEDQEELSHSDLLEMDVFGTPQQSRWLQMLSSMAQ